MLLACTTAARKLEGSARTLHHHNDQDGERLVVLPMFSPWLQSYNTSSISFWGLAAKKNTTRWNIINYIFPVLMEDVIRKPVTCAIFIWGGLPKSSDGSLFLFLYHFFSGFLATKNALHTLWRVHEGLYFTWPICSFLCHPHHKFLDKM